MSEFWLRDAKWNICLLIWKAGFNRYDFINTRERSKPFYEGEFPRLTYPRPYLLWTDLCIAPCRTVRDNSRMFLIDLTTWLITAWQTRQYNLKLMKLVEDSLTKLLQFQTQCAWNFSTVVYIQNYRKRLAQSMIFPEVTFCNAYLESQSKTHSETRFTRRMQGFIFIEYHI